MTWQTCRLDRNTNSRRSTWLLGLILLIAGPAWSAPEWIEHASNPGPDIAAVGQSRFDDLYRQTDASYRLPYPFSALITDLQSRMDIAAGASVPHVYVPLGRSLQRDAPAPHYFRDSREVITLEGEPKSEQSQAGRVMEYRLFIAHQPTTHSLEVISYNDQAGRFEFQVVENYNGRETPRVTQASRAMCMSCHQNAAPIFSVRPWSETSFSVSIANHLIETRPAEFSSLIDLVTLDTDITDVLIDRANYLSAAQQIWRYGCPDQACRAALLRAILQYRLSGEASFDRQDERFQDDYYRALKTNWHSIWPNGLALASHRIPDRDPFSQAPPDFTRDPLFERKAHARWFDVDDVLASGIVYRLEGFLTHADIDRLDRHLITNYISDTATKTILDAACKIGTHTDSGSTLSCRGSTSDGELKAHIEIEGNEPIEWIRFSQLRIPGDPNIWQPDVLRIIEDVSNVEIRLAAANTKLSARLSDGRRIHALRISGLDSEQPSIEIELIDDFELIDNAIDSLVQNQSSALSSNPFRRDQVLSELMSSLDMPPLEWPRDMASASGQQPENVEASLENNLALLDPYCAHCHAQNTTTPPGFLFGDDALDRVTHCAPRILSRLAGWQNYPRVHRSPMPPAASLPISSTDSESWPVSDHYRSLYAAIEALLDRDYSATDYEDLPACLPNG